MKLLQRVGGRHGSDSSVHGRTPHGGWPPGRLRKRLAALSSRRRRTLLAGAALFVACLVLVLLALPWTAAVISDSAWLRARRAASAPPRWVPVAQPSVLPHQAQRIGGGGIHSVAELRQWCDTAAPSLGRGSWVGAGSVEAPRDRLVSYPVVGEPVCLRRGVVYIAAPTGASDMSDGSSGGGRRGAPAAAVSLRKGHVAVRPLLDSFFPPRPADAAAAAQPRGASIHAVPAMALLVHGNFVATHVVHLIHDVLEALNVLLTSFHGGELLSVPTQTVLLRGARSDWAGPRSLSALANRTANTPWALSAAVLNGFSSIRAGGPFFTSSLVVHEEERVPLDADGGGPHAEAYCFCQALIVSPRPPATLSRETYLGIQRAVAVQFAGERPYNLTFASPAEEEADRHSRAPPGTAYWRDERPVTDLTLAKPLSSSPPVRDDYLPRALFVHRDGRRIQDVDGYVAMLRAEGFRVEEVYPERLSIRAQYHLGRYADVVVGMHGQGLIHGLWMDPEPKGCRAVVEFLPWIHQAFPIQFQRMYGVFMGMNYHQLHPTDVVFDPSVRNAHEAKARLKDIRSVVTAFRWPVFSNQTCIYSASEVREVFHSIREHLAQCLYQPPPGPT